MEVNYRDKKQGQQIEYSNQYCSIGYSSISKINFNYTV